MTTRLARFGVDFPFFVAPMVGLSHVAFRELVRSYSPVAPVVFTEMLSTRRVPHEKLGSNLEVTFAPEEPAVVPQLLAYEEDFLTRSIDRLLPAGPWGFDINMGCPVKHTLRHSWGVRLTEDRAQAARVIAAAKRASALPVSAKLRVGTHAGRTSEPLDEFVQALTDAGIDWISVHPRPAEQRHKGAVNWEVVQALREKVSLPVVGNGNIQTAEDALGAITTLGLDGAMIGRAAVARPWIFWQILAAAGSTAAPAGYEGRRPPEHGAEEGRELAVACLRLIELLQKYGAGPVQVRDRVIFFLANARPWYAFGHSFWSMATGARTVEDLVEVAIAFRDKYENRSSPRAEFR